MVDFGLVGGVERLCNANGAKCFIYRQGFDSASHLFLQCLSFKDNFALLKDNLKTRGRISNSADGYQITNFIDNLDQYSKM